MNSNKLWTFGDSFTEGVFDSQIEKLTQIYGYSPVSWTEILASKLNLTLENISKGGISNYEILGNILENLPNIKKGDVVIISDTIPIRTFGYNTKHDKMISFNNEFFIMEDSNDELDTLSFDDKKILIDYVSTFILKYEDKWIKYWNSEFKKIVDICLSNEIECFYWSHLQWKNFTCLSKETNGLIEDDHWGSEGNKKFADYLYNRILNKDYYDNINFDNLI